MKTNSTHMIDYDAPLSPLTSFGCGGRAERLVTVTTTEEAELLRAIDLPRPHWLLGYGTNILVSDYGLNGSVLFFRGGKVTLDDELTVVADAGVWWDDVVGFSLTHKLWGLELMSGIPGSVGAAVAGNIAAYGQAVADTLVWADLYDTCTRKVRRLTAKDLGLSYRSSYLHTQHLGGHIVLRAAFKLSRRSTDKLGYRSAVDAAEELGLQLDSLEARRKIILYARGKAGSLYGSNGSQTPSHRSAGSFFKNPLVTTGQARRVMAFDETGRDIKLLSAQNKIHGGDRARVSAAHVLLAAGFRRGQSWGAVRLHPDHVLKIENTGGATSQEIYEVGQDIMATVKNKLDITLEPEVRFMGRFD